MTDYGNPYGNPYGDNPTPSGSFPANPNYPTSPYYPPPPPPGATFHHDQYQQNPPQPAPPRSRMILILVAAFLFAGAGVFAGLYVAAERDHDQAVAILADKRAELADVKDELSSAEEEKATAKQTNSDLKATADTLRPCFEATQHYLWDNLPEAERDAALDVMWDLCQ